MTSANNDMIRLVIDYGAIENMLRAIHAVGEGFAGKMSVATTGLQITQEAKERFGRETDMLAAQKDSPIAHVYEYGRVHGTAQANVAGRLWRLTGSNMGAMTITFRASTADVPLDPAEENPERRSRHTFVWKAPVQEFQRFTRQRAGTAMHRKGGAGQASQWLLIYDEQGRPMFRKTWMTYSPYYGNFRKWFHSWWQKEAEIDAQRQAEREVKRQFAPVVEREVNSYIRRNTRKPIPARITSPSPINFTNNAKPLVGKFNIKPSQTVKKKTLSALRQTFGRRRT